MCLASPVRSVRVSHPCHGWDYFSSGGCCFDPFTPKLPCKDLPRDLGYTSGGFLYLRKIHVRPIYKIQRGYFMLPLVTGPPTAPTAKTVGEHPCLNRRPMAFQETCGGDESRWEPPTTWPRGIPMGPTLWCTGRSLQTF